MLQYCYRQRKNIYYDANTSLSKFIAWKYSIQETKQIKFTNILTKSATAMKVFSTERLSLIDEIIDI